MKLGIMDDVLGRSSDPIARAKSLGFEGIEINLKVAELSDERLYRQIADRAQAAGVEIASTVLGEHNSGGLATWWRGSEAEQEVLGALRATRSIGASTLLLPFFFFNEPKGKTHRSAVAQRLKPLCDAAQSLGVVIAFEGVTASAQLVEMAGQIGSPAFGVYFDPANMTWCDFDAASEIRTLGPLLRQIHAKDANTFTGDARLGKGRVDHAACAAALESIGYDRWIILETPGGTDAEIASDLNFARSVYQR